MTWLAGAGCHMSNVLDNPICALLRHIMCPCVADSFETINHNSDKLAWVTKNYEAKDDGG